MYKANNVGEDESNISTNTTTITDHNVWNIRKFFLPKTIIFSHNKMSKNSYLNIIRKFNSIEEQNNWYARLSKNGLDE